MKRAANKNHPRKRVAPYAVTSMHFTDADDLDRVKQAAAKSGKTVSAFLAEVATKAASEVLGQRICEACGRSLDAASSLTWPPKPLSETP